MIINGPRPDLNEAIARNEIIAQKRRDGGHGYPFCGHDFWEQVKKLDFGDVIMCNRCHVYYAKIRHLPWLVKGKDNGIFKTEPKTCHCDGVWMAPIPARVTD
jgi:hypothetical protein